MLLVRQASTAIRSPRFIDRRTILRARKIRLRYGVFLAGPVATGLIAVLYARLIDFGYEASLRYTHRVWWLPLMLTLVITALGVWVTRQCFHGAEGSGMPQVIATLDAGREVGPRLLTIRILTGKIVVSFLSILGGLTFGREGLTIHVGASLMFSLRRFYPAIIFAGIVLLGIEGKTTPTADRLVQVAACQIYWRSQWSSSARSRASSVPHFVGLISIRAGRWMPAALLNWRGHYPVVSGAGCGLIIALVGVATASHTFGSDYAGARGMLDRSVQLGVA